MKDSREVIFAEVDVTTRWLFWEHTERKIIFKEFTQWQFLDTGEWTPEDHIEKLAYAYKAQELYNSLKNNNE